MLRVLVLTASTQLKVQIRLLMRRVLMTEYWLEGLFVIAAVELLSGV